MKALTFVDLHSQLNLWPQLEKKAAKADFVLCAGDFTLFEQDIEQFLSLFNSLNKPFFLIHGNHETAQSIISPIKSKHYTNLVFLHQKIVIKNFNQQKVLLAGYGGGGFSLTDENLEKFFVKVQQKIKTSLPDKIIILTHAPPYNTPLDRINSSHHGSKSLLKLVKTIQPHLLVCGHFHENAGKQQFLSHKKNNQKTLLLNPGPQGKIIKL